MVMSMMMMIEYALPGEQLQTCPEFKQGVGNSKKYATRKQEICNKKTKNKNETKKTRNWLEKHDNWTCRNFQPQKDLKKNTQNIDFVFEEINPAM